MFNNINVLYIYSDHTESNNDADNNNASVEFVDTHALSYRYEIIYLAVQH